MKQNGKLQAASGEKRRNALAALVILVSFCQLSQTFISIYI